MLVEEDEDADDFEMIDIYQRLKNVRYFSLSSFLRFPQ